MNVVYCGNASPKYPTMEIDHDPTVPIDLGV